MKLKPSDLWDNRYTLDQILDSGQWFLIRKKDRAGFVVEVITGERTIGTQKVYDYTALGVDRTGITYKGDGCIVADFINDLIIGDEVDFTADRGVAVAYLLFKLK